MDGLPHSVSPAAPAARRGQERSRWLPEAAGHVLALLFALLVPALAVATDGVPRPTIDIAKPGRCVEDVAVMRRAHGSMLNHQRDLTMRQGIRAGRHSLNECVGCHASATTGSVLGEKGFCQSCHDYVGVKLDCFGCHAAKPKPTSEVKQ